MPIVCIVFFRFFLCQCLSPNFFFNAMSFAVQSSVCPPVRRPVSVSPSLPLLLCILDMCSVWVWLCVWLCCGVCRCLWLCVWFVCSCVCVVVCCCCVGAFGCVVVVWVRLVVLWLYVWLCVVVCALWCVAHTLKITVYIYIQMYMSASLFLLIDLPQWFHGFLLLAAVSSTFQDFKLSELMSDYVACTASAVDRILDWSLANAMSRARLFGGTLSAVWTRTGRTISAARLSAAHGLASYNLLASFSIATLACSSTATPDKNRSVFAARAAAISGCTSRIGLFSASHMFVITALCKSTADQYVACAA